LTLGAKGAQPLEIDLGCLAIKLDLLENDRSSEMEIDTEGLTIELGLESSDIKFVILKWIEW